MKTRLRLFPAALALSFLIGCAGEEGTETETPSPAPAPTSTVKPAAPTPAPAPAPAPAGDSAKDKAPEPTPDKAPELTPAPAGEAPKDATPPPADAAKPEDKPEAKPDAKPEAKPEAKPSLEGPSADAGAVKLSDEELASIKELPADQQPAALAQAVCPVSDEHLGSMGAPVKVSAEGRTVYLCCKGCRKDFDKDPKAALAKLDELTKK
jgi:YHS domain-containing protein